MKVKVYFYRQEAAGVGLVNVRLSRQAIETVYDLVWEQELKNVITIGQIWLQFLRGDRPFGHPLKEKRPHAMITSGDIIEAGAECFYMVMDVGVKQIELKGEQE